MLDNLKPKTKVGVLTSGGDSQGMNAAIRAIVRAGLKFDLEIFLIKEGYDGLVTYDFKDNYQVDYNNHIMNTKWFDVSGVLQRGGTVIGSARCMKFKTKEGRKLATKNLLYFGISNLCVIGGDGSLTGADFFRAEWKDNVQALENEGVYSKEYLDPLRKLQVVGLVGSIDNDFCGTDMTIGVDSALHRITESIDTIQTTASSHQRVFVLEVMGRHCGYLSLMSALGSNAEYCFIPEAPPKTNWKEKLIRKLELSKTVFGNRAGIVIVAEGAVDIEGNSITSAMIKDTLSPLYDTRITVLGHVQRGGNTAFYDRLLATRMGVEAAKIFAQDHGAEEIAKVMVTKGNKILAKDMMELVKITKESQQAMHDGNYKLAMAARGKSYEQYWKTYKKISKIGNYTFSDEIERMGGLVSPNKGKPVKYVGFMAVGAPCAGMNGALKCAMQHLLTENGHSVRYRALEGGV